MQGENVDRKRVKVTVAKPWRYWLDSVKAWQARSRERQQLAAFSATQCKDIGINRTEVWREINKPFWKS